MDIIRGAAQFFSGVNSTTRFVPEPVARGVDFAASLAGARESLMLDVSPEYRDLINKQLEAQAELQQTTMVSNIERSKHESRMSAIRNIRVS